MNLQGAKDSRKVRRNGDRCAMELPLRSLVWKAKWLLVTAAVVMAADMYYLESAMLGGVVARRRGRRLSAAAATHTTAESPAAAAESGTASGGSHALPAAGHGSALASRICSGDGHSQELDKSLNSMLCAVLCGLVLCIFLDHMNTFVPQFIRFPISCIIFLSGIAACVMMDYLLDLADDQDSDFETFLGARTSLAHLDPHALFFVILPPLLYESSSGMQWHVLRKVLPSSIILAGPGVIINLVLTALACKGVLIQATGAEFTWAQIFLLATLLSATDPVAVVAALRNLGAPAKLSSVIDGESLLNDGSAYVVFCVFMDLAGASAPDEEKLCPGSSPSVGCVIGKFLQLAAGGCLIGWVSGLFMGWWIKRARFVRDSPLELAIILTGVYGTFFLAETLKCSGVLAEVILGMTVAAKVKSCLSAEARHEHHMVIGIIAYLSDKVIFFAAGFISARFINDTVVCDHENYLGGMVGSLFFLYFILHVVRGIVVALFAPVLRQMGYGLTFREGCLLTFAGLRGALGLAMGLFVENNAYIGEDACRSIAFYTSGIVFLTLVINGATVDEFYKRLNMYKPSQYRIRHLTKQLQKIELKCQHRGLRKMQRHWFFSDCDLELISNLQPNFATLAFSEFTVTPITTGLLSVKHMLNAVEARCLRSKRRRQLSSAAEGPEEQRAATTKKVVSWLTEAVNIVNVNGRCGKGDMLMNVIDVDHGSLEFRRREGKTATAGCYWSRRHLDEIVGHNAGSASFWVHLAHIGRERIVVGLSSAFPGAEDFSNPESRGVLGVVPCSVGLDTSTGEIFYNNGSGTRLMEDTWEALVPLVVRRSCSLSSEIIGHKAAGEVFVGYKVGSWIRLPNKSGVISVGSSESHASHEDGTNSLGAGDFLRQFSGKSVASCQRGYVMKAVDSVKPRRPLAVEDEIIVSVNRRHGQPWHVSFYVTQSATNARVTPEPELVGIVSLGEFSAGDLVPVVEFRPPAAPAKKPKSLVAAMQESAYSRAAEVGVNPKVILSFAPEVSDVDYSDCLAEVFTTLFNTLEHHYHERHQHGVISTKAYQWLSSSASEALDCANREVHAKSVLDLKCVERTEALVAASAGPDNASSGDVKPMSAASIAMGEQKRRAGNPFEPIMVEYLFIKHKCTKVVWWEKMAMCASRFPSWGSNLVKRRLEALYAFIDCHEQVLSEFGGLERFPGVQYCLEKVIEAAKADLWMLQDLSPRRFYFYRHVLLLKIVIGTRMRLVEEDAEEGWLEQGDAEPLLEFTQDLLARLGMQDPTIIEDEDPLSHSQGILPGGSPTAADCSGRRASEGLEEEIWSTMFSESDRNSIKSLKIESPDDEVRV